MYRGPRGAYRAWTGEVALGFQPDPEMTKIRSEASRLTPGPQCGQPLARVVADLRPQGSSREPTCHRPWAFQLAASERPGTDASPVGGVPLQPRSADTRDTRICAPDRRPPQHPGGD